MKKAGYEKSEFFKKSKFCYGKKVSINKNTLSLKIHFKMQCLHSKEAASTTTEKGHFWFCAQNPKCQFICSEEDGYLYDRAIQAFLAVNQVLPKCCVLEDPDDP